MSFIRCLSNPEALYGWHDTSGTATFTWNVESPLSSKKQTMAIPIDVFYKAVDKWHNENGPVEVAGFKIEEQHIFVKTGKRVKKAKFLDTRKTEYLVRISYKGRFVFLWRVTWAYVVNNVISRTKYRNSHKKG